MRGWLADEVCAVDLAHQAYMGDLAHEACAGTLPSAFPPRPLTQ
ncbi:hypothetical protein ACFYO9_32105 [Streptomyces sp. NPDC005863]